MIKNLKIKNFKSIKNVDLRLKNLNILSGANGTGKSTLCQAILFIKKYLESFFGRRNLNYPEFSLGQVKEVLFEGANEDKISLSATFKQESFDCDFDKDGNYKTNYQDKPLEIILNTKNNKHLDYFVEDDIEDNNEFSIFVNNIKYLKAERIGPKVIQEKNDEIVIDNDSIGLSGEYTYSYLESKGKDTFFDDESNRVHIKSSDYVLINQVTYWLGEISPNIVIKLNELEGTNLVNLCYSYKRKIESNNYRVTNVGFGITYSLPVIVMCLSAKKGDILIIDTPEAHLHPKGQVKLGELLARTAADGIQLIIETHSDHIINGIRKAVLKEYIKPEDTNFLHFSMSYDKNDFIPHSKIYNPKLNSEGLFNQWPEDFFDQWTISNKELLDLRIEKD